jgi:enoyl-CoA hydratase/carnithine racemase
MSAIQLEIKKGVAQLTLNRPQVRNAFDATMIAELSQCFF